MSVVRLLRPFLSLVCLCALPGLASAARTVSAEGVIDLATELGQVSAMVFPEEVSTVTTPISDKSMQVSKDNVYVGFVPLNPELPPNRNVVVGLSGRIYLVNVKLAPPGKRSDDVVYVTHKPPSSAPLLDAVSVIRTLRWPQEPLQAQVLTLPLPVLPDTRLALGQVQQYTVGPYQALVLTLENTQAHPLQIDARVGEPGVETPTTVLLSTWLWPPGRRLQAVAIEQEVLPAQASTIVYAVFHER